MSVTVADIERRLARDYPPEWAEEWDRVGLLAGDPSREVSGVALALDPTVSAIRQAKALGANVLVTHHPAFLKSPQWLTPGRGSAGVVFAALESGVALINAHTNLDRAPAAGELLPERLGLKPVRPIERSTQPMTLITVFAPNTHQSRIVDAMAGAGAGRVGEYTGASFTSAPGTGAYVPGETASPFVGEPGVRSTAEEIRIEMVAPRSRARGVVGAARGAHPYEEPLIVTAEVEIARNIARMGMLSRVVEPLTLGELAQLSADVFGITPRVWGDRSARIELVGTATGSAGSLVGDALATGAHALVAGEVRYHDALDAVEAGLSIVELGHDVSEWPLVGLLTASVLSLEGIDPASVHELPAQPGWWTP
jgi:dinuclear metal center YbgI/SA1388 family protein